MLRMKYTKNILLIWNAIRKTSWEIKINVQDPKGTHNTCNFVEHIHGIKKVCSNYINPGDEICPVHRTLTKLCAQNEQHISLFPVIFSEFVIYIKPEYENQLIGRSPKSFQISRKLLTEEFKITSGNL